MDLVDWYNLSLMFSLLDPVLPNQQPLLLRRLCQTTPAIQTDLISALEGISSPPGAPREKIAVCWVRG